LCVHKEPTMKNQIRCILRGKQHPNLAERAVAEALYKIEHKAPEDLKKDLRHLRIVSCHEIPVSESQKAIIVQVPFMQRANYRKVQAMLANQMEKKFGKHVIFVTKRTIVPKPRIASLYRPRSMTRTNVHEAILNDIVYPASIVGERIRCRPGCKKQRVVLLDNKDKANFAGKIQSFQAVFKKLTGTEATFEFPVQDKE